jgi:hypothetical protein
LTDTWLSRIVDDLGGTVGHHGREIAAASPSDDEALDPARPGGGFLVAARPITGAQQPSIRAWLARGATAWRDALSPLTSAERNTFVATLLWPTKKAWRNPWSRPGHDRDRENV